MHTAAWPAPTKPSSRAAAFDTSIMRPLTNGPRSLMRTTTALPLPVLVTFTLVPNGRLRWAAVRAEGFIRSPDAVLDVNSYHEARPHWAEAVSVKAASTTHDASVAAASAVNLECMFWKS